MPECNLKTLEEHKAYVKQMACVSFFFASQWLKERTQEKALGELLRDHTPLFYHTLNYPDHETKWNNPDCLRIVKKANELKNSSAQEFEEIMYSWIKKLAMERAERFYPTSVGVQVPPDYNAGSLKYDPPKDKLPSNYCNFHIANAVFSSSIFKDPQYLPRCFMELMDKSEKEYNYNVLHTGTWLNDESRWLALFPEEWHKNLSLGSDSTGWSFGYWGQLVTARGTFNEKAGQYVREHGKLKYKCRSSHCSFEAMRKHLSLILKG